MSKMGQYTGRLYKNTYENKSHKVRSILNENLPEISNKLNLSVPLKLKTARDCYACALKRKKKIKNTRQVIRQVL